MNSRRCAFPRWHKAVLAACAASFTMLVGGLALAATPPQVSISSIPLTLVAPAHPQVLVAIGNSESMDGNLSGAIMTGSGTAPSQLYASSSPQNFTIPPGFTPPLNAGSGGVAPYTVTCGSYLCDNSPSRLNVAKQAVQAILNTYAGSTDFGLLTYSTSGRANYTTWLYLMSQNGGFTFSASNTPAPASGEYVNNPCYNVPSGNTVYSNCNQIAKLLGSQVFTQPYMLVQYSSDDPFVNDVLYASGLSPVCLVYGTRTPSSPFPPNYTLSDYNAGGITVSYSNQINTCARTTGPTNAGFVPFQDQTMYVQRGFGYISNQSYTTGNLRVPISSAGSNPTPSQVQAYIAQFTPYLQPETNNTSTSEIKAEAVQSPIAGMMAKALSYYTTNGGPPSSNGCKPLRYVILITDGLPTQDLNGNLWPPVGSISAQQYGMTASFNADGSLDVSGTNDQALIDAVNEITALKNAGIKTYVVGVGAGVNPNLNPQAAATLTAMAVAGGTGNYFPATDPAAVTVQLQVILSTIQGQNLSVSSAAVNSTGLRQGAVAYQAQYTSTDQPWQDWTGNLLAYAIDPNTGVVNTTAPIWKAQSQLDTQTQGSGWDVKRLIATWNPTTLGGAPFRWSSISTTQQAALTTGSTDTLGPARLNYLRGDRSNEQQNGGTFRNRSHILGDIVDSNPLFIGAPQGPYIADPTYVTFESQKASRPPTLYVGANDGMLHAFDANTGNEKFAYVPNGVFANLINLANPLYNQQHRFFVDGSPAAGDVKFSDGTWHTVLVGGLNAGGNSIYALDVTDPSSINNETALASSVLWEYTDSTLGLTYSRPAIALTNATSTYSSTPFLVFFGSGYNNSDGNDYLYAVNVQTGALVEKINLCAAINPSPCKSNLPNGLSSPVVIDSSGGLGTPADTVYAGDLQGNLWKVDISDPNPNKWAVSLLFQARDSLNNPQPITTTPAVSFNPQFPRVPGPVVYFGTGQFLGPPDVSTTSIQSFYAVWDNNWATNQLPLTRSKLTQQVLTDVSTVISGKTVLTRTVTNNKVSWTASDAGWFMDLPDAGERSVTDPRIENGAVVFTTYVPAQNTCSVGGKAFLMVVNYQNGGSFPQPEIDINGDGVINSNDTVNGQNPVGLGLGNVYATAPTILSASLGNVNAVKLVTLSTGQIKSVLEHGPTPKRKSWWELK